ncbi:MAG: RHS repeat-associated core domain-containing protein [Candidatus Obscuribacterales bacterium]|nr:RHS repeat-associated core domain-containing protein [Candidatus Obscuribacterales bacterium]
MTDIKLNGAPASASHFDYDPLSRRTALTLNNGTNTAYSYALNNDLTGLQHNYVGSSVNYTLGYNNVHQINSVNCSDGAYIKHPYAGGTTAYTVNNMNQYTAVGASINTYSADGCLTKIGTNTLQYDTEKHLTKQLQTGSNLTFVYDPILQRQAQVKANGATPPTRYIYDGMRLIATYNGNTDALLNRFIPGVKADESLIQVAAGGATTYNHADWLGSIISVSNNTGAVAAQAAFDVFGQGSRITLGGQPFGFTGQIGNGLFADYNFKARYYSPALGRFYQPDLIPSDSHQNLYTYVGNDPINSTDPSGMLVVGGVGVGIFHPPPPGLGGAGSTLTGGAVGGPSIIMNSGGNTGSGSDATPGGSSEGMGPIDQSPGGPDAPSEPGTGPAPGGPAIPPGPDNPVVEGGQNAPSNDPYYKVIQNFSTEAQKFIDKLNKLFYGF